MNDATMACVALSFSLFAARCRFSKSAVHSAAESKLWMSVHFDNGCVASHCNMPFGAGRIAGPIRYQPTRASAAAWRSFICIRSPLCIDSRSFKPQKETMGRCLNHEYTELVIECDYLESCNCDFGCTCNFSAIPTGGHCEALVGYHVRKGNFGNVSLDGLDFIYAASGWLLMT
jgi:hypothetical protein